jgi:serine O-acetyltransferase
VSKSIYRFILALSCIRLAPHIILVLLSSSRGLIWADLDRWGQIAFWQPHDLLSRIHLFVILMTFRPEYRTAFYLRTGIFGMLLSIFCRPMQTLSLAANTVGGGLYIEHGHGTMVSAEEIGVNCWINQLVTVGHTNATDRPTIGDNVSIRAGATIVGKVRIGDNSTIGANSLVIMDVPPDVTVMGVPARIVWRRDSRAVQAYGIGDVPRWQFVSPASEAGPPFPDLAHSPVSLASVQTAPEMPIRKSNERARRRAALRPLLQGRRQMTREFQELADEAFRDLLEKHGRIETSRVIKPDFEKRPSAPSVRRGSEGHARYRARNTRTD